MTQSKKMARIAYDALNSVSNYKVIAKSRYCRSIYSWRLLCNC